MKPRQPYHYDFTEQTPRHSKKEYDNIHKMKMDSLLDKADVKNKPVAFQDDEFEKMNIVKIQKKRHANK